MNTGAGLVQQFARFPEFTQVRLRRNATYAWLYSRHRYVFIDPAERLPTTHDPGTIVDVHDVDPPGYEVQFYDAVTGEPLDLYTVYEDEILPW
jgi:hypothetical protein